MRRRQSGITLIEMLIVGLVGLMLGAALVNYVRSTYESQSSLLGQNASNTNARTAVDELADNLRGAVAFTAASASDVTFTWRNPSTGVVYTLRYLLSGTDLIKQVTPENGTMTQSVIANDVQSMTLTYLDVASGAATTNLANIGAVQFAVTATYAGTSRQMRGTVQVRQKR